MSGELPDWLKEHADPAPVETHADRHHLEVLRRLLARDYLTSADWAGALGDLARMAREGLEADRGLVAYLEPGGERWSAIDDEGRLLSAAEISKRGSTQVLERVVQQQAPVLTTTQPLAVHSESVQRHDIHSVLAVPLFWRDVTSEQPRRYLGACLYVHRAGARGPFTQADVALVTDIAHIAQPNLNLLRHLRAVESELQEHRAALERAQRWGDVGARLGGLETLDPTFAREVIEPLKRVSRAHKVGLLILGPTGSGKTHLARAYHQASARSGGPFVTLDCGQITSVETLSAELFGYAARSGYANAPTRGRPGKAQLADGGTLFIDEIGTLPAQLQRHLLRLVQEGRFAPLGSSAEVEVDVQIVSATNDDLKAMVAEGTFREDLYWRIREIEVRIPPLDERQADIPALAEGFLERARARFGRDDVEALTPGAAHRLVCHPWSRHGNIRGLEHTINRAVLLAPPDTPDIGAEALGLAGEAPRRPDRGASARSDDAVVRGALLRAMERLAYNASAMARDPQLLAELERVGEPIPLTTLNLWLRELELYDTLQAGRREQKAERYHEIVAAIREHGSGSAAARALGLTRDALVWQLRKAGKTIGDVLADNNDENDDDDA
ncbi:MAG: hypothetical protein CMH57_11285 [Myxococcales bacterium]|nr:hypothetical protein [Myxococcales bacterium]